MKCYGATPEQCDTSITVAPCVCFHVECCSRHPHFSEARRAVLCDAQSRSLYGKASALICVAFAAHHIACTLSTLNKVSIKDHSSSVINKHSRPTSKMETSIEKLTDPSQDSASSSNRKNGVVQEDADEDVAVVPPAAASRPRIADALAERLKAGASPTYLTPDGQSWIIHVKHWMPTPSPGDFEREWDLHPSDRHQLKLFGKTFTENRWSQSWGFSYSYSGSTNVARPIIDAEESSSAAAMVQVLIDRVNEVTSGLSWSPSGDATHPDDDVNDNETVSRPYNGCLQNWYHPEDTIGLHADDERDLLDRYPIFSLSWGGTRRFVLKPREKKETLIPKVEVYLEDGDLLVMGGNCQKTHRHEVPKLRATKDPGTSDRISWTVRAFRDGDK